MIEMKNALFVEEVHLVDSNFIYYFFLWKHSTQIIFETKLITKVDATG